MEAKIKSMGLHFRNLTLHSDGRWSVQVRDAENNKHLVHGNTPEEALDKALVWLPVQLNPRESD